MKKRKEIDYDGLKKYLESLTRDEIETNHRKPIEPKLIEGHSIEEIQYFNTDISKYRPDSIIQFGDAFLVDLLGNDLSIVILTRKKYKAPNGCVYQAKFVKTIIEDCRSLYGTPLNGYWIIPKQFFK